MQTEKKNMKQNNHTSDWGNVHVSLNRSSNIHQLLLHLHTGTVEPLIFDLVKCEFFSLWNQVLTRTLIPRLQQTTRQFLSRLLFTASPHILNRRIFFASTFFYEYRCCTICIWSFFCSSDYPNSFVTDYGPVLRGSDMRDSTELLRWISYNEIRYLVSSSKLLESRHERVSCKTDFHQLGCASSLLHPTGLLGMPSKVQNNYQLLKFTFFKKHTICKFILNKSIKLVFTHQLNVVTKNHTS